MGGLKHVAVVAFAAVGSLAGVSCGGRSALEGDDGGTGTPAIDASPVPVATCTGWAVAGPDVTISEPTSVGSTSYFTSIVPSGDGVLATWSTLGDEPSATWSTRAVRFDATPRAPIQTHLSFSTTGGVYVNVMSLAVSAGAFAGIVDDPLNGCRFVPLDADGNDGGAPVVVAPAGTGCSDLGAAAGGFSFLSTTGSGNGVWSVSIVNPDGSPRATGPIATASPTVGGRLVLHDESFLLATFAEVDAGGVVTSLQHLAADGSPLAPPFVLTDTAVSLVSMAEASTGVLTAWLSDASSVVVRPVDGDGRPTSPPARLAGPGANPLYGLTLAPTPNGEAMLAWFELVESSSLFDLFVMALAPDGAPRGGITSLGSYADLGAVRAVVEAPAGERAVLVFAGGLPGAPDGVHALPLGCVQ